MYAAPQSWMFLFAGTIFSFAQPLRDAHCCIVTLSLDSPGKLLRRTTRRLLREVSWREINTVNEMLCSALQSLWRCTRLPLPSCQTILLLWRCICLLLTSCQAILLMHCRQTMSAVFQLVMEEVWPFGPCLRNPKAAGPRQQTESGNFWPHPLTVVLAGTSKLCTQVVITAIPLCHLAAGLTVL